MCLCNGSGGIQVEYSWGVQFHPCPDTNCSFDREKNEREYKDWKQKWINEFGNIFDERKVV